MAEAFRRHGVAHRLIGVPGGEHGLAGAEREAVDAAYRGAFEFVAEHLAH